MNRICLILFDLNNRILGPYLAQEGLVELEALLAHMAPSDEEMGAAAAAAAATFQAEVRKIGMTNLATSVVMARVGGSGDWQSAGGTARVHYCLLIPTRARLRP
jgi:hypothetical protein